MEYNPTYLDEEELPQLDQDQHSNPVDQEQFIHDSGINNGSPADPGPVVDEEELLAAQAAADAAVAQQQQHGIPGGVFANVAQGLVGKNRDLMMQYWQETINSIEHDEHDFKNHQLPLARIKKVMKTDEDVKMISAEAPILFAKGCDVFITELSMRAWIHAEENKRRTLQKSDIAAALTKSDMFDFLIDVVPREEEKPKKSYPQHRPSYVHSPLQLNMLNQQHMQQMRVPQGPLGPGHLLQAHESVGVSQVPDVKREAEEAHTKGNILRQSSIPNLDNARSPDGQPSPANQAHMAQQRPGEEKQELFGNYSHYEGNY